MTTSSPVLALRGAALPLPHQEHAIDQIMERPFLLVEYGTGTGKSRIIAEVCRNCVAAGDYPILVTVANSLLEQTTEEFETWLGETWVQNNVSVLDRNNTITQRAAYIKYGRSNVFLVGHEALSYKEIREAIAFRKWAVSIVDEASRFRRHSNRTRTLQTIGRKSETRYAFTGNLMPQAPTDVFYVMNYLDPGLFGTRNMEAFKTTYCILGGFTGNVALSLRPDKLDQFKAIMDARRITCELSDIREMPDRILTTRRVDMAPRQATAYKQMREQLLVEIERETDVTFRSRARTYATRLQRLQEICAGFARNIDGETVALPSPKSVELLELLTQEPDIPTVIWYWWTPERDGITNLLAQRGLDYVVFGSAGDGSRERFTSGKTNIFISQLAKGGYGLNLTRAERMIYHSLPWSVDIYSQSQERNRRLTTVADRHEIVHLVVRNSVDEYVRNSLIGKANASLRLTRSAALEMLRQ